MDAENLNQSMENITQSAHRRQMYQKLLESGTGIIDNIEGEDMLKTLSRVNRLTSDGNEMFGGQSESEDPRSAAEVVMDLQVLKMSNELISKSLRTKGMTDFHDEEFVNSIKEIVMDSNQQYQWERFDAIWGKEMKVVSCAGYTLLGSFGEAVKEKKESKPRAKRARNTFEEEKKPENVAKLKQETKSTQRINDVYRQVLRIYEARKHQPIPYFELVCDPNCFMNTIHNILQVSFLSREGILTIMDNESDVGYPIVKPQKKAAGSSGIVKDTTQAVSSINYCLWKKCIDKYNITKPLLQKDKSSSSK